jgi:prepilin-type N-terminal cleavage/methylation domain-containing protein
MISSDANRARGFTLVELMVSAAIIGMLSTVAVGEVTRAQYRSKAAERATVMQAIGAGVNDLVMQRDGNAERIPGDRWAAGWNPRTVPGRGKLPFDWTVAGWGLMPMVVKGNTYYSYAFTAVDPAPRGSGPTLNVWARGDLDGDGDPSDKRVDYAAQGYAFYVVHEDPEAGAEDADTF